MVQVCIDSLQKLMGTRLQVCTDWDRHRGSGVVCMEGKTSGGLRGGIEGQVEVQGGYHRYGDKVDKV